MKQEGFEYIAVIPADLLLEEARAEAEARGQDVEAATDAVELPDDPNDAIVEKLSSAEVKAYELAYWGPNDVDGCYYNTYEEAWGVDVVDLASELDSDLAEAEVRIAADPQVIEAREQFVKCVNSGGHSITDFNGLQAYVSRRESEVVKEILDSGADDVYVDDPLWIAYEQEVEEFTACEDVYLDIVAPIENAYLGSDN